MVAESLSQWKQWLTEDEQKEFAKAGYYSKKIVLKDGTEIPKARFIGFNTQAGYWQNLYNFGTHFDATGVLDWLEETLAEMEKNGEIAIIGGHVPPSHTTINAFSVRFNALVERYQHIIRTNLFGHVHLEYHMTAFGENSGNPYATYHMTSSITTYRNVNPGFRVLELDAETLVPVKMETHFFDIENPEQGWQMNYDTMEMYGLKDLSPSSFVWLAN